MEKRRTCDFSPSTEGFGLKMKLTDSENYRYALRESKEKMLLLRDR